MTVPEYNSAHTARSFFMRTRAHYFYAFTLLIQ